MTHDTTQDRSRSSGALQTFLVADLRGYTRFSDEHGDEAASDLARRFAEIVRETTARQGDVLELRGDEALCVFGSARAALNTAVDLQRCFRERVGGKPALPVGVGIGLDAGEAVPTEGGYRGRALNVAARLCGHARPGEILVSETVAHLAGRQDTATYAPRRPIRVKGVEEPVRFAELVPTEPLPPLPALSPPPERRRARRRQLIVSSCAAVLLSIAALAVLVLESRDGEAFTAVEPNSVAVIDPDRNRVVDAIPVGNIPTSIAVGGGAVWVLNGDDGTVTQIHPETRRVVRTFATGTMPAELVVEAGSVWLAGQESNMVARVNPQTGRVAATVDLPPAAGGTFTCDYTLPGVVGSGEGAVWVARCDQTLARVDPAANRFVDTIAGVPPGPIATGEGAVWVAGLGSISRVDPRTKSVSSIDVAPGFEPLLDIAVGFDAVWATRSTAGSAGAGTVWKIDPRTNLVERTVTVGAGAFGLEVGDDALWVANGDGTVSRMDPRTSQVVATIRVGGSPRSIAVGEGAVWVTVS